MYRRILYCIGAGAGTLAALGPFEFHLAGVCACVCLLALTRSLRRASVSRAVLWGFAAAVSIYVFAFQWIAVGLMNIAAAPAYVAVPALLLQSLFFGAKLPFLIAGAVWLQRRTRLPLIWTAAGLAAAGDLFLYQLFPWHFGNLVGGGLIVRQFAAVGGVYGLSAIVFLEAALIYGAWRLLRKIRRAKVKGRHRSYFDAQSLQLLPFSIFGDRGLRRYAAAFVLPLVCLIAVYVYGLFRVIADDTTASSTVNVAYMQTNTEKGYAEDRGDAQFARDALNIFFNAGYAVLRENEGRTDLLIAPESAVPFYGTDSAPGNQGLYSDTYHAVVAYLARYGNVDVLYNELVADAPGSPSYYNAATIFGREGERRSIYAKRRLVPFGEYLPGETSLPWLRDYFPETARYVPGDTADLLEYHYIPGRLRRNLPELTQDDLAILEDVDAVLQDWPAPEVQTSTGYLLPLICYEGLFPDLVRSTVAAGAAAGTPPDFLVNVSNDAWFGDYLENFQHAAAARMRAIEADRYMLRVTLTGPSHLYDPLGRSVVPRIPLRSAGIRIASIPRRPEANTLYLMLGDVPVYVFLFVLAICGVAFRRNS